MSLYKDKYQKFYSTFFDFYSINQQILTYEGIYKLIYYTFLNFYRNLKYILMFHHILQYLFHAIVEAYIDQGHILIDKIFFNCMLTHLFSLKIIRNKFYSSWIFHYCCNTNI